MNTINSTEQLVSDLINKFGGFGIWDDSETHFEGWKWHVPVPLRHKYTRSNCFYVHTSEAGQLLITRFANQDVTAPIFDLESAIAFIEQFDQWPEWNPEV